MNTTVILNQDLLCLFDINGNKLDCGQRKEMKENSFTITIDLSVIQNFTPLFIGIRKNEKEYYITELPT